MGKKAGRRRTVRPQLVVRISEDLDQSLREAADGLELDLSGLVRMILAEHVGAYVERGVAAGERLRHAREKRGADKPGPAPVPQPPREEFERNLDLGSNSDRPGDGTHPKSDG